MVCQYGPGVPEDILKKLVSAFAELREMADEGKISYPYSTREVVNIVRHLQVDLDFVETIFFKRSRTFLTKE